MALQHHHRILLSATLLLLLTTTATSTNVLLSDDKAIRSGTKLTGGSLTLDFGSFCNLQLYDNGKLVKTFFTVPILLFGCTLYVDKHGVVYVAENFAGIAAISVFGSRSRSGHYALVVGNGKLGVYGDAIWSSRSVSAEASTLASSLLADTNSVLFSDDVIIANSNGNLTLAANGDYSLILEPECNLAVANKNQKIWETKTSRAYRSAECQLTLRADGELVLGEKVSYEDGDADPFFHRLWGSGVWSEAGSHAAVVTADGRIVVYGLKDAVYEQKNNNKIEMMPKE